VKGNESQKVPSTGGPNEIHSRQTFHQDRWTQDQCQGLEDAFWKHLKEIAHAQRATLPELVTKINETRQSGNLSSAIRLFVLEHISAHH
jgi:hypothetical protein